MFFSSKKLYAICLHSEPYPFVDASTNETKHQTTMPYTEAHVHGYSYKPPATSSTLPLRNTTRTMVGMGENLRGLIWKKALLAVTETAQQHAKDAEIERLQKALAEATEKLAGRPARTENPGRCPNCQNLGHDLSQCVVCLPGDGGMIPGCTLCNTMSHTVDSCLNFGTLPSEDRYGILVGSRAMMPPLRLSVGTWHEEAYKMFQENPAVAQAGIPWSENFAEEISQTREGRLIISEYEEFLDKQFLKPDRATVDLAAFCKTYGYPPINSSIPGALPHLPTPHLTVPESNPEPA